MFEQYVDPVRVSKQEFEEASEGLRLELLNLQFDLKHADFPLVILVGGDDLPGRDDVVDRLQEWMDARLIDTHFFGRPTPAQAEMPRLWRYWSALPANGRIGLFISAWPSQTIARRLFGEISKSEFEQFCKEIADFERALVDDGTLLLKIWMHVGKEETKRRWKKSEKDPQKEWRLEPENKILLERFDHTMKYSERLIKATDLPGRRWFVFNSVNSRHRDLTVGRLIRDELELRLSLPEPPSVGEESTPAVIGNVPDALGAVDLTAVIPKPEYDERMKSFRPRLRALTREARNRGIATVLAFEGWDAAGKGGVIRRMTRIMSARDYSVIPIAAPSDEERAHHYLWRFWRHIPRPGHMTVFDRTWGGRLLVERVEGFASEPEWVRSFSEIATFERQIMDHGMVLLKFWLHISPEEQFARFQTREKTPYKKYKLTDEDYRNQGKRAEYERAINEMVAYYAHTDAPWRIISANNKRWARVQVIEAVCTALERRLERDD